MDKDVLQIEIPEGYELDKENSTSFNVKFKKKEENEEPKVRTWEDLIGKYVPRGSAYIAKDCQIGEINRYWAFGSNEKNLFIDLKHAKSALAMSQISQLMPYYGGAITDEEWSNKDIGKYCIERHGNSTMILHCLMVYQFLTFHTREQAEDFLKYNKQLVYDYLMLDLEEQI